MKCIMNVYHGNAVQLWNESGCGLWKAGLQSPNKNFILFIYIAYGIGPKGSTQKTLLACSKWYPISQRNPSKQTGRIQQKNNQYICGAQTFGFLNTYQCLELWSFISQTQAFFCWTKLDFVYLVYGISPKRINTEG